MDERLLIGVVHLRVRHGAVRENRDALIACCEEAAGKGAQIIAAPELAVSGYGFDSRREVAPFVEEITGETVTALSEIARRFGVYCCTGLAEMDRATEIYYNSAVVLGPDGTLVAHHRKRVAERRWSCPGQPSGTSVFGTPWGKVGVLICADSYYGLLARSLVLEGADLLMVLANWPPAGLDPREIWRARALENGVGLVAANRTGKDHRMDCTSAPSYAVAPEGDTLLDAACRDSLVHYVEYPLEAGAFPSRRRKEMVSARCPRDWDAIALDGNGLDDATEFLGLPPAGPIRISCLVPPARPVCLMDFVRDALAVSEKIPAILLLPEGAGPVSVEEILRHGDGRPVAVLTNAMTPSGSPATVCVTAEKSVYLAPGTNAVMIDFGPARIALVRSEVLKHPEQAVALSKQGCDVIIAQAGHLDGDARLLMGIKCLEKMFIAVAAGNGAFICEPPEGHNRWRETIRLEPGVCTASIDTAAARRKLFLDRVDMEVLLRR